MTLTELLDRDGVELPPLRRAALVHGHCYHKAVLDFEAERRVLERLGLDVEVLDSGCCGMAGSFGYERDHYDVSMKIGEGVLLPRVRAAPTDTLLVADGFSCRAQVEGATGRRPLHVAEVLDMAIADGPDGPVGARPERRYGDEHPRLWRAQAAGIVAGVALAAVGAWYARRRWR